MATKQISPVGKLNTKEIQKTVRNAVFTFLGYLVGVGMQWATAKLGVDLNAIFIAIGLDPMQIVTAISTIAGTAVVTAINYVTNVVRI